MRERGRSAGFRIPLCAVALIGAATASSAEELRQTVEQTLGASYPIFALRAGAGLKPGSQEEKASLAKSINGVMALLPDDCTPQSFKLTICGLGSTHVASDAMAPTVWAKEAVFFVPYGAAAEVQRGDIALFDVRTAQAELPVRHMFRIIGLPGETVELINGVVNIDGKALPLEATDRTMEFELSDQPLQIFRETMAAGRAHLIARNDAPYAPVMENAGPFHVPDGHFFVLGDNRHNAADSRFPGQSLQSSFVSREQLVGRVALIYVSADPNRTGKAIDAD